VRLRDAEVLIAGLGLIGGSLALAIRKRAGAVRGVDPDPVARAEALRRGAVREAFGPGEVAAAAGSCDLMVLAAPLGRMAEILEMAGPALRPGTVVTDLGSAKVRLIEEMETLVPPNVSYIPGHPMAGSDARGMGGARMDLYCGATWMLACEPPELLAEMITATGALIHVMPAGEHDRIVAHTSHLPYLMAAAAAAAACEAAAGDVERFRTLTAGGFRDTTRVAACSPSAGADMCMYNREQLLPVLGRAAEELADLTSSLLRGDRCGLRERLERARDLLVAVRGDGT
jgi:prephenate dehydrogenase